MNLFIIFLCITTALASDHDNYNFTTKWIELPVDHFSFSNNATFQLRYLVNDDYYTKYSPIFFYTGNEGDISMFAQNTGFMFDIAPKFNALIVFAEHRYYGKSLPFGNESYSSPAHLGYLTSSQALADYVYLIDFLQRTYLENVTDVNKLPVVAFGGSYGGMLSSWLRIKYPHSVVGSIASSAPIWQFQDLTPCENFYRIVTNVFQVVGSDKCSETIGNSWDIIRSKAKTDEGKASLSKLWKLCAPLTKDYEVDKLANWLSNIYTNLAMVNYPYPTNFLAPLPANPVKVFCNNLTSHDLNTNDDVLTALAAALEVYTNFTGKTQCTDINATSADLGEAGWNFQACTEMVMPMCSNSQDMFESVPWNYQKYSDDCFLREGVRPLRPDYVILEYGGKDLKDASNIVFSNGLMDPWSSGGVLGNISSKVVAIVIPNGAHHFDLRGANADDSEDVIEARKFHVNFIRKWLNEFYNTVFSGF